MNTPKYSQITVDLSDITGNVFDIMGRVTNQFRQQAKNLNISEELILEDLREYHKAAMHALTHNDAYLIANKYVNIILEKIPNVVYFSPIETTSETKQDK